MDHLAARKIPDGYMANDGDQVVLTQTGQHTMLSGGATIEKDSPEHLDILHHNHLICWLGKNCIL